MSGPSMAAMSEMQGRPTLVSMQLMLQNGFELG